MVFALAEVLGAEKLGQADEGSSLASGLVDTLGGFVEVMRVSGAQDIWMRATRLVAVFLLFVVMVVSSIL